MEKKSPKKAAILYKQVAKSYDKVTVGKAIWKQVMIAAIMFARSVLVQSGDDIKKIQAIENSVYRYLLGVAGYVAVEALRGEIGASKVETRMMEATVLLAKDSIEGDFEMVKTVVEGDRRSGKGVWI